VPRYDFICDECGHTQPRYDFICDECGHTQTVERKIARRNDPVPCEEHDGTTLMRRVIGAGGFSLKGEGWYADGYAKKAPS
jgi:putative FmdB family regulatory protein